MKMRVGDWVEVRSKEEILGTLDKKGRLEGLPFMPQMFKYCAQRFQVFKRAHKTCDWVYTIKSRWLPNCVHLNLRCDGDAYGDCQAACLLYWKEAWLKRVDEDGKPLEKTMVFKKASCTEEDVISGTYIKNGEDEVLYTCQGTELPDFTKPISRWNLRQYWEDYSSGNVTLGRMLRGFIYAGFWNVEHLGIGIGLPLRWFYDAFQFLWGRYPGWTGKIPHGQPTPTCNLNLQPGEMVRVKSYNEILATLDNKSLNRGLRFDAEMVPYCGGIYPVKTRLTKFVDEKTRKLKTMKNACILLENVWCQSRYSRCRIFCPRAIYSWWHEIWLERVTESAQSSIKPEPEKQLQKGQANRDM